MNDALILWFAALASSCSLQLTHSQHR